MQTGLQCGSKPSGASHHIIFFALHAPHDLDRRHIPRPRRCDVCRSRDLGRGNIDLSDPEIAFGYPAGQSAIILGTLLSQDQ